MTKQMINRNKGLSRAQSRGFTLIELLVVIAIIGILSSVVLASLNTARGKGNDAKVKANLSGLRTAAEIYYDNAGGNYGTATNSCTSGMFLDSVLLPYVTSSNYPGNPTISCQSSGSAYAVSVPLTTSGQHWCVDSVGSSQQNASAQASGDVTCN